MDAKKWGQKMERKDEIWQDVKGKKRETINSSQHSGQSGKSSKGKARREEQGQKTTPEGKEESRRTRRRKEE